MNCPNKWVSITLVVIGLAACGPAAELAAAQDLASDFTVTDVMVPTRDGVHLNTKIFTPKESTEPLPIILLRTPYGIANAEGAFVTALNTLADEGYIFVFQDIRGKFASEGSFVMLRPTRQRDDEFSVDEASDTYDSIEWLLENVPDNNGRAVVPKASPADMWLGDDFHHNGAFRLSYGFEYAYMVDGAKESQHFPFDRYDTYDWYLSLGPLSNVNEKYLHGKVPTWNDYVEHPGTAKCPHGTTT